MGLSPARCKEKYQEVSDSVILLSSEFLHVALSAKSNNIKAEKEAGKFTKKSTRRQ